MSFKNIPFGEIEKFNVVLEIPKGSRNKYEYDEELDEIKLDFVFTGGFRFIYNYGYIPETRAGDGDHLDVIILTPDPIAVGVIVPCRAIGMIEMLDRGEEDNKLIAVPTVDIYAKKLQSIEDLSEDQIEEFKEFNRGLAIQKNKTIDVKGFRSKDRAVEEIKKARKIFKEQL